MRITGLFLVVLMLFFQGVGTAQSDKEYAKQIEELLDFKEEGLKDTLNALVIKKAINKNLDARIKKVQKLKRDPDSISTKTISLLQNMKVFANDHIITDVSSVAIELIENKKISVTSSIKEIMHSIELLEQLDTSIKLFGENAYYVQKESKELLSIVNNFRIKSQLEVIPKEKEASKNFGEWYVLRLFDDFKEIGDKKEEIRENIDVQLKESAPEFYTNQKHRFEFKDGTLYYNSIALRKGQAIGYIETKLGTDYIAKDSREFLRYKNIPLEIGISDGTVTDFFIKFKATSNDSAISSFLDKQFIKLEGSYFNKNYDSLVTLVAVIHMETFSPFFKIKDTSTGDFGDKVICYINSPDNCFYINLVNQKTEIKSIRYTGLE